MIAKYIVFSNIISVVSDNILRIVLLHALSAYNSLHVRYKVYSSDPRECLCTSWRYVEAYKNFSIHPAPCQKNPIKKNKIVIQNCQPLLLGENYTGKKRGSWSFLSLIPSSTKNYTKTKAKVSLENLVRNVLKENKLWSRMFKSAVW